MPSATEMRRLSLAVLVFQTTVSVLSMRYCKLQALKEGTLEALSTTNVFCVEVIKLSISALLLCMETGGVRGAALALRHEVTEHPAVLLKLTVPSILYTFLNNLQFVAIANLTPAVYQVAYQLKILTTAIFTVVFLGRHLAPMAWVSLPLLMVGVATVQLSEKNPSYDVPEGSSLMVGLTAVVTACVCSGFAGVYFERILKGSSTSLWVRNVELALCGIVFALVGVYTKDYDRVMADGLFQGYTRYTVLTVCSQSLGGLAVALVVKYADVLTKAYVSSISIIMSSLCSVYLFDFKITVQFAVGAGLVVAALVMYSKAGSGQKKPRSVQENPEKKTQ
eukprot:Rmarinus@m.25804